MKIIQYLPRAEADGHTGDEYTSLFVILKDNKVIRGGVILKVTPTNYLSTREEGYFSSLKLEVNHDNENKSTQD